MTVTPTEFRSVMGRFPTGVAVMTTRVEGSPYGMTANAITSVSLDPLLVLVCVGRDAQIASRVEQAGTFALSLLPEDMAATSDRFADPARSAGEAAFGEGFSEAPESGAPIVVGAIAYLDCRVWATYDGGDHLIVVGEVLAAEVTSPRPPLVYDRSGYTTVAPR